MSTTTARYGDTAGDATGDRTSDTAEETPPEAPATGRRRALLIGVGHTELLEDDPVLSRRFPRLGFVDRDVELVRAALADSDYTVVTLHPGHEHPDRRDTGVGSIVRAVEDFLLSCEAGDTAFLYVSAHGVTVGEREYLLTSDARPRADGSFISQTILETAPEALLGVLPTGVTVVVCLDICRTEQPPSATGSHETPVVNSAYRDVAWLRACGSGQQAYADPEKGSYFGIALSEALSPHSPPESFKDVHAFVQGRVERLTAHLAEPPPTVEPTVPKGFDEGLVLCRGSEETQRWTEAVTESVLWQHTSHPAAHERVKVRLDELAREVAKSRLGTDSALATPWSDPDYPVRVVARLGHLVKAAGLTGRERLSPAETAALLAAPLLHEGVVAVALSELAALRPDRIDRREDGRGREPVTPHDDLVCDAARDVSRAHSQVGLAAETLRQRRLPEAATAADHWLRHRFIADWDRLWDRTGDYPALDRLLDRVVEAVAAGAEDAPAVPSAQTRRRVDRQVRHVLPHMTVAPGSSPRINDNDVSEPSWGDERAVRGNTWRGWDLAYLLWFSALLAADPRRMSSVLVDHLGAHRPLAPAAVVEALAEFDLESVSPDGGTGPGEEYDLAVDFSCPHPALHVAVEELAGTADASVRALRQSWKEARRTPPDLLRGLPQRVTAEYLKPRDRRYTEPLERFRLAEDEIRPLLMGTQLYGDKMLAVRELYQNALDACRHRQLRVEYGRRLKKCGAQDQEPGIEFVQAYDEEDRPYIECRDTGTGMSRRKLTSMFARAGKRYEQDPDFVQERRNWRRARIEPIPFNSRFGIGVFSYFMLAEEVVVTTGTIDLYGNPSRTEAPLQATIQSGSGLLEIRETTSAPQGGGTVVRLYLSADGETPPSLVETLRKLLWVSDHRVTAVERDREGNRIRSEEWTPGKLQASGDWPARPVGAGKDAWLVQGQGQLLLDGVVIKNAPAVDGYVVNLRERDQPVPTVDRNGLIGYDREGVEHRLLTAVPEAVGSFEEVSLRWLWDLALSEPKLAVEVFDSLGEEAVGVLHPTHTERSLTSSTFPLRDVGCLPIDGTSIRQNRFARTFGERRPYESHLFDRWRNSRLGMLRDASGPFSPSGYPSALGLDALLFDRSVPDGSYAAPLRAAALAGQSLAAALRTQRRYAISGVQVPETHDGRALDTMFPSELMADLYTAYADATRPDPHDRRPRPAGFAPLLPVAAAHDLTLNAVLASAQELTNSVPMPGWEIIPQLSDSGVPETEAATFAAPVTLVTERRGHAWQEGVIHPVDLLVRAPGVELRKQLVERIDELRELGFSLGPGVSGATLDHRALTGDERRLLSRNSDGEPPWVNEDLTVFDVLKRSKGMRIPVGRVVEQINELTAATAVSAPPVTDEVADWTVPHWVGDLLPGKGETPGLLGPWRLAATMRHADAETELATLRRDVRNLDACGVLAPGCRALVEANVEQISALDPFVDRLLNVVHGYSHFMTGRWNLDVHGLGVEPLAQIAAQEKGTLVAQVERLATLSLPLPLKTVPLPEPIEALAPGPEVEALFEQTHDGPMAFRASLTCQNLTEQARYARKGLGATVRTAQAFLPVGGPALPGPFTGPDADALEDFSPDDFDLAAFDPGLLGPGVLGPLELVLVAGRFGWTLGKAYERYAPFRCLGLDVTVKEPVGDERDLVPDWRDVIVLTARLTGRAPAVERVVDPGHVLLCVEETDLSESEVLDRLRSYSRLFDLTLPTPGGPRP
ncbi:caspase family protein [Streptomyces sp. NBC_00094]|uniref:HD domain-containing protein n=1 Tax=Streptomyces sp. NBC_00094 TaxID=2903620 RepID=UPI002255E497|nr:caspase family protein [Streptomyces sp. NBC_00094]MCX5390100.1 caspase family protein [Streptomyces sp. NBC_00094]